MNRAVLVLVGLTASSVTAYAAETPRFTLLADVGWSQPQASSFGDAVYAGGGANLRLNDWFSVQGLISYSHFPISAEGAQRNWSGILGESYSYVVGGGALSNVTYSLELKIALAGNPKDVVPYLIAGGGVVREAQAASTVSMYLGDQLIDRLSFDSDRSLRGMGSVGLGADVPVRHRLRLFVELRYQMISRPDSRMEDVGLRAGIRLAPWQRRVR